MTWALHIVLRLVFLVGTYGIYAAPNLLARDTDCTNRQCLASGQSLLQRTTFGHSEGSALEQTTPFPGVDSDDEFIAMHLDRDRLCLENRDGDDIAAKQFEEDDVEEEVAFISRDEQRVRPNDYAYISHLRKMKALSDPPAPKPNSSLFLEMQSNGKYLAGLAGDQNRILRLKFDYYPCGRRFYNNFEGLSKAPSGVLNPGNFTDYRDQMVASIGLTNKPLPIYKDTCPFDKWIKNKSICGPPLEEQAICGRHWAKRDGFKWSEGDELRSLITENGAVARQPCNAQTGLETERYFFCPEQVTAEGGWAWAKEGDIETKIVPGSELRKDRVMVEAADGLSFGTFLFHISGEGRNPARMDTYAIDIMLAYFTYLGAPELDPDFFDKFAPLRPGNGQLTDGMFFAVATNQRYSREIYPQFRSYFGSGKLLVAFAPKLCDPAVDFSKWATLETMKYLFGSLLTAKDVNETLLQQAEEIELPPNQQLCDDMVVAIKLLIVSLINQEELLPISGLEEKWSQFQLGLEHFDVFGWKPFVGISKHMDLFSYGHATMLDKFPYCPHWMSAVKKEQEHFPKYSSNTHARWHLLAAQSLMRMYRLAKSFEDLKWDYLNRIDAKGLPYRYRMEKLYKPDPRNDEITHPNWAIENSTALNLRDEVISPDSASKGGTKSNTNCKPSATFCKNRVWLSETRIAGKSVQNHFLNLLQHLDKEIGIGEFFRTRERRARYAKTRKHV